MKTFEKLHAAGNDFILFDFINSSSFDLSAAYIEKICHRQMGAGADGVVVLDEWDNEKCILKIRLYNSDGSISKMCANGTRCAAYYFSKKNSKPQIQISTLSGTYTCLVRDDETWLTMGAENIKDKEYDHQKLNCTFKYNQFYFADSGVPHSIFFVNNLASLDVKKIAPAVRHASMFAQGCNVNFVEKNTATQLQVRTFERGVEDETLSCGTGILAITHCLKKFEGFKDEIIFHTKGGILKSKIENDKITYGGKVYWVYSANLHEF